MLTLGDVFAFAAIFVGFAATVWGATILTMLLASAKIQAASDQIRSSPYKVGLIGLGIALVIILAGIILSNVGGPLVRVVGVLILLFQTLLGVLGAASVASIAAEKIRAADSTISEYGALVRSSLLVVSLASIPFLGWFIVTPILLAFGTSGLFAKKHAPQIAVPAPPVQVS